MEFIQYITLIVTLLTGFGFLWRELKEMRLETRADIEIHKSEIRQTTDRTDRLYEQLHQETKDFHGRLCKIEEQRLNLGRNHQFKESL